MAIIFWTPALNPPLPYPSSDFPAPEYGNIGDIRIRSSTGEQHRWNGTSWNPLAPNENRGDTARPGGQLNDRLSQIGSQPLNLGWRNAADGVVFAENKAVANAEDEWTVNHQLTSRLIDVTVFTPGNEDTTSNIERTIVFPEVIIVNPAQCRLKFVEPVSGTAIIRR